jgi:hypothetical protein
VDRSRRHLTATAHTLTETHHEHGAAGIGDLRSTAIHDPVALVAGDAAGEFAEDVEVAVVRAASSIRCMMMYRNANGVPMSVFLRPDSASRSLDATTSSVWAACAAYSSSSSASGRSSP